MTKPVRQQTGFMCNKEREILGGQLCSLWKNTEKLKPILVWDKCMSNIIVGWPLFHILQRVTLLGWPMILGNGKSTYISHYENISMQFSIESCLFWFISLKISKRIYIFFYSLLFRDASTSLVILCLGSLRVYQKAVYFYCCVQCFIC